MKEASGELNMTLVTIIAIVAIGTLFATVLYPLIKNTITSRWNSTNSIKTST